MVVGVHGLLGAELAARDFDAAIGDDLVDIHVALRAAAGLPDAEGEVVVEFAGGDFVRGLDDERGDLGLELAEVLIDERAGLFQDGEVVDDLERNAVVADVEMDE